MTIRVTCDGDGCGKPIDRADGGWFGVDFQAPPVEADLDDGIVQLYTADHEFHFCSPDCIVAWAFARSFQPSG